MNKKLLSLITLVFLVGPATQVMAAVECRQLKSTVTITADDCLKFGGAYIPEQFLTTHISKDLRTQALKQSASAAYQVATVLARHAQSQHDKQLALAWYELAAAKSYTPALLALAYLYEHGATLAAKDIAKATDLYQRAVGFNVQNQDYFTAVAKLGSESATILNVTHLSQKLIDSKRQREQTITTSRLWRQELQEIDEGLVPMEFIDDQLISLKQGLENRLRQYRTESTELIRARDEIDAISVALNSKDNHDSFVRGAAVLRDDFSERTQTLDNSLAQLARQQKQLQQHNGQNRSGASNSRLAFNPENVGADNFEQYLKSQEKKLKAEKLATERRQKKLAFLEKRIAKLKSGNQRKLSTDETVVMQRALTEISQRYQGKLDYLSASVERESTKVSTLSNELTSLEALSQEKTSYISAVKNKLDKSSDLVNKQSELIKSQSKNLDEAILQMKAAHPESELGSQLVIKKEEDTAVKLEPRVVIKWPAFELEKGNKVTDVAANSQLNIVGAVYSDSKISSVSINQKRIELDANGLFAEPIMVGDQPLMVSVLIVTEQSEVVKEEFLIRPRLKSTQSPSASKQAKGQAKDIKDIDFGNYFAIVIGNNEYQAEHFEPLDTAIHDAESVANVLETKYGFKVSMALNATRDQILKMLKDMRNVLTEKDNLLIYYAGHGIIDPESDQGYWLPSDASSDNTSRWISNPTITDHIRALSSKNVLVVADSCYSASLMRGSALTIRNGLTPEKQVQRFENDISLMTRVVLSSGGLQPVVDSIDGSKNSVFTGAMLKVLTENDTVLDANALATEVSHDVVLATKDNVRQVPRFAPLLRAGHEGGDFYFVPSIWRSE